jgi:hypothetical protein
MVWAARRRCQRKTSLIAFPVHLPDDERPLFIEMSLRFTKSEMAFESPRLQAWEADLKSLLIASPRLTSSFI